jgi:hypothetical protein
MLSCDVVAGAAPSTGRALRTRYTIQPAAEKKRKKGIEIMKRMLDAMLRVSGSELLFKAVPHIAQPCAMAGGAAISPRAAATAASRRIFVRVIALPKSAQ